MKNKYEYPVGATVYVIMQLYYGALLHRFHVFVFFFFQNKSFHT